MANWYRKNGKYATVQYYKNGKHHVIPRKKVKHLDAQSDTNVEFWVKTWSEQYEGKKIQEENILFQHSQLNKFIEDYRQFLEIKRKKSPVTYKQQISLLKRFALPFFLSNDPPLKDPNHFLCNSFTKFFSSSSRFSGKFCINDSSKFFGKFRKIFHDIQDQTKKFIEGLLKKTKLPLSKLSDRIHISGYQHLSDLKNGRKFPSYATWYMLFNFYRDPDLVDRFKNPTDQEPPISTYG